MERMCVAGGRWLAVPLPAEPSSNCTDRSVVAGRRFAPPAPPGSCRKARRWRVAVRAAKRPCVAPAGGPVRQSNARGHPFGSQHLGQGSRRLPRGLVLRTDWSTASASRACVARDDAAVALGAEAREQLDQDQQHLHPQPQHVRRHALELMRPPQRPAQAAPAIGGERPQPPGRGAPELDPSQSDLRPGHHSAEGAGHPRSGADPESGSGASSRVPGHGSGSPEQRPGATRRVHAMRPSALGTPGSGRRVFDDRGRGQADGSGPGALPIGGFPTRAASHWMGPVAAAVPDSLVGPGTVAAAHPVRRQQQQQPAAMATTGVGPALAATATAAATAAARPALSQAARELGLASAGTIRPVQPIVLAGAPGREARLLGDDTGWELRPPYEEADSTPSSSSSRRATLQFGEEAVEVVGPFEGPWSPGRCAAGGSGIGSSSDGSSYGSRGKSSVAGGGGGGSSSRNGVAGHGGGDAAATGGLEGGERRLLGRNIGAQTRGRASERHTHGGGPATRDLYGMINRCESWRDLQRLQQLHSSQILPGHIAALMAATAKLLSRRAAAAASAAAAAAAGDSPPSRLSAADGSWRRPSAVTPSGSGRQGLTGGPDVIAAAGDVSGVGTREGGDVSGVGTREGGDVSGVGTREGGNGGNTSGNGGNTSGNGGNTSGNAVLYDSAGAVAYMWGLAASALRLARSRELLPRSFATALWAVAKMPLELMTEAAEAEAAEAGRGHGHGRTHHQQRHAHDAAAAAAARYFPRREEWAVWSVEMLRCGAALLLPRGPYGSSPLDVSLTLWAVARLGVRPLPPGWLQEVVAATQPRLGSFGPQALSNTLWALRRLRYQPSDTWLQAACAAAGPQLPAFSRQDLANFAAALAHFEHVPPPAWRDSFLACCSAQWDRDLLWLLPQLARQGPARVGGASAAGGGAAAATEPPPPPQSAQWLAQSAWAVARLGLRPPPEWVCGLAGAVAAAAPYMNGEDVSQVLWALGELRWREVGADAAAAVACHCGLPQGSAPELGHDGQQAQPRVPGHSPESREGRRGEVHSQHHHHHDDHHDHHERHPVAATGGEKLRALLAAWWRCSEGMEPQQLSACLVGLTDLGLQVAPRPGSGQPGTLALPPAPAVAAIASAPCELQGIQQEPLPPQQQKQLQQQVLYVPERVVERSLELLARRLPAASAQAVSNVLWAVVRLGYRPASGWVAAAVGRFMSCLEDDDAGPQEAAVVWWALGRLRWAPPAEDAQELFSRTMSLVAAGAFRSGELAMILWAMTRLGLRLPQHMLSGFVKILRRTGREEALATATAAAEAKAAASGGPSPNNPNDPTASSSYPTASPSTAGTAPATARLVPSRGRRPAVVSPEVSPETLVTLLRALGPSRAVSQRSTLAALLERQLRPLAAAAAAAAATAAAISEPGRPEAAVTAAALQSAAPAYGDAATAAAGATAAAAGATAAAAARQVAVALRAAADVGVSMSWREKGSYGTAGAALAAAAAALPAANARDLAMTLNALAAMNASAPLSLMAAALQRAGELCAAGRMAGPGDLPLALSGLGRLVREMVRRRRAQADAEAAAAAGALGAGRRGVNTGGKGRDESRGRRSEADKHGDEDDKGGDGADAVETAVRARWAAMLCEPPLAEARAAVLAAALNAVRSPVARRRLTAADVRQLLLGFSAARLAPPPALLRALALAVVRHSAELSDDHCTACVRQLASMGADMDPRVARVLVGRMSAGLPDGKWRLTWRLSAACTGVEAMVAVGVLRRTGSPGRPGAIGGGRGGGGGGGAAASTAKVGAVGGPAGECELRTHAAKDAVKRAAIRADPGVMRAVYDSLRSLRREAATASAAAAAATRTAAAGAGLRPGGTTAAAGAAAVAGVAARNAGPKVAGTRTAVWESRTVVRDSHRKAVLGATAAGVSTAMVAEGNRTGHDAAGAVGMRAPVRRSPPGT